MNKIRKAVFPVAGLGTRFLPATKASPKEMLAVVDKPLIQYAVEEAAASGITEMIFITGRGKRAIEDHFDRAYELEAELGARGKKQLLQCVRHLVTRDLSYVYVRQANALGLGHAVLCARQLIKDEPFAVILADDLIDSEDPVLRQMIELHGRCDCSIVGVQNVSRDEVSQYGIIKGEASAGRVRRAQGIVEKPKPAEAPSTLGVVGRYILTPRIFEHLESIGPGAGGEIQLTDAIQRLIGDEGVIAYEFAGIRYDCGNKLGYLKAQVAFGLKHPDVAADFAKYLAEVRNEPPGEAKLRPQQRTIQAA